MSHGVLSPRGDTGIVLAIIFPEDNHAWRDSASWEPIESVLTAAGLPCSKDWMGRRLDKPGQATMQTNTNEIFSVLSGPPVIVKVSVPNELTNLGLDPHLGVGVIEGILLTCANFPGVAAGVRLPNDEPLTISLDITSERPAESDDGQIVLGMSVSSDPAEIAIQLGPDWFEYLAEDSIGAHESIGELLAEGRERLVDLVGGDFESESRANFLGNWNSAPPIIMARNQETSLSLRHKGMTALPRNRSTQARALRTLAKALYEDEITPCTVFGSDALNLCRASILPAVDRAIRHALSDWSERSLMIVADKLNDAHGERARAATEIQMALSAPWAENWKEFAQSAPNELMQTRPLEILLELLLEMQPTGRITPDAFDVAEIADLVGLALHIGAAMSGAENRLNDLMVTVDDGGLSQVLAVPLLSTTEPASTIPDNVQFDAQAYNRAARAHQLRRRDSFNEHDNISVRLGSVRDLMVSTFISINSIELPGSLLKADQIMKQECGTGLDGIRAVLAVAETYVANDDRVAQIEESELRDEAVGWSSLSREHIEAALTFLTFNRELVGPILTKYVDVERRRLRLTTRPLIQMSDALLLIPWQIHASQNVYFRYLLEGRIPWHPDDLPETVRRAFNDYRRNPNIALERAAASVAERLKLPHIANIKMDQSEKHGLKIPGEIDLLVADPEQSRLWVCEVKDVSTAFSPGTVKSRIDKFFGGENYIEKLIARARAIRDNPSAAARLMRMSDIDKQWRIVPVMITRDVEPAAFVLDPSVSFVVINDFEYVLRSIDDPGIGITPIGEYDDGRGPL
jgi:hypothetical protein